LAPPLASDLWCILSLNRASGDSNLYTVPLTKLPLPIFHWAQAAPSGYRDKSRCV